MEQPDLLSAGRIGRGLTPAAVRARFASHVSGLRVSEGARGDHDLSGEPPPGKRIPAAVLVGLVDRAEGLTVLLTRRTAHLNDHAGQIALPGGRIDSTDPDPVFAALRETEEEVGLPRDHIEVIGRLDTYITGTGFEITPVVGLVRPPFSLRLQDFEVAEAFEVPLAFIIDPAHHERHTRELRGRTRSFMVMRYGERYIWGATAAMLVNLAEVLAG
jgi:8-oxo-dGTP pyrophosphatase MutT (NUDIX family)